jgi:hypothetical protein
MHFFYLDETGCDGASLDDPQEPVFVLGGVSVKDQGWVQTTKEFKRILCDYFSIEQLPAEFELHAHELLSPDGEGSFLGHERSRRNALANDLLELVESRGHQVHFAAIDKRQLDELAVGDEASVYDTRVPYLFAYDYLLTYIERFVQKELGQSSRGMVIMDFKPEYQSNVDSLTYFRRWEVPKSYRLKWVVEFSYPVDSVRHPFIQLSDLVVFCIRKFFEMDRGYRQDWTDPAREFYAQCFAQIYSRVRRKGPVDENGKYAKRINPLRQQVLLKPSRVWRKLLPS